MLRKLAFIASALVFASSGAHAECKAPSGKPSSTLPASRVRAIDALFTKLNELAMFNGSVIVDIGGKTVFRRDYGFANYENCIPLSVDSIFRIASVSKNMTDAALSTMFADGLLKADATVADYLPDFPRGREITIEHLVTHRSGIVHPNNEPWGDGSQPMTLDEIIAHLAAAPLDFDPGTERRYSNGGFAVLTKIMELASGKSYPDFMRERVFGPLGMTTAGAFTDSRAVIPNMARGYEPGQAIGSRRHSRHYYPEARPGGGSLYASPGDVMTFAKAYFRNKIAGAEDHAFLFGGDSEERAMSGRAPGFSINVLHERKADIIVVAAANNYSTPYLLAENVARLALGEKALFELPETDLQKTEPEDSAWVGDWSFSYGPNENVLLIRRGADGHLFVDVPGDTSSALIPLAGGAYLEPVFHGLCRMPDGDRDRITCDRLAPGGFVQDLKRRAAAKTGE